MVTISLANTSQHWLGKGDFMSTQEEKKALLKQAYKDSWDTADILDLWQPLGFNNKVDMADSIEGLYNDRLTTVSYISDNQIYLDWCEYQRAAIDGSLAVANQVSKDNIFRAMLFVG
jgi:hypothetical protein